MKYYFAPMEGITGHLYRNLHAQMFPGITTYYAPFVTPRSKKSLTARESNDIHPDNNVGLRLVPQILTNSAEGFLETAEAFADLGYPEVNLNLGCPSGTVVSKGRGSGFLAFQPELERFLEEIYAKCPLKISIKTRIGLDYEEEWEELMPIYNRFPIDKLIIHPRLRSDYYKNHPHMEVFRVAVRQSVNPVVYNGDLYTPLDVERFSEEFPQLDTVMIGRGLLINPALVRQCQGGEPLQKAELRSFHDGILSAYQTVMPGDRAGLFKMKELWTYWGKLFPDAAKPLKQIRKAQRYGDYHSAVDAIFRTELVLPR